MKFVTYYAVAHVFFLALLVMAMQDIEPCNKPAEVSELPVFATQNWKFEMTDEKPQVAMVNGIEHVTFQKGSVITLIRE